MRVLIMMTMTAFVAMSCAGCAHSKPKYEALPDNQLTTRVDVRLIGLVMRSESGSTLKYIDVTKFAVGGLPIDPANLRVPDDFVAFQYKLKLTSGSASTAEYTFALGREQAAAAPTAVAQWESPGGGFFIQSGWFYFVQRWPYSRTGTTIGPSVHSFTGVAPPGPPPHFAVAASSSAFDRWYLLNADRSLAITNLGSTSSKTLLTKDSYVEANPLAIAGPFANNDADPGSANAERVWIKTVAAKFPWP